MESVNTVTTVELSEPHRVAALCRANYSGDEVQPQKRKIYRVLNTFALFLMLIVFGILEKLANKRGKRRSEKSSNCLNFQIDISAFFSFFFKQMTISEH